MREKGQSPWPLRVLQKGKIRSKKLFGNDGIWSSVLWLYRETLRPLQPPPPHNRGIIINLPSDEIQAKLILKLTWIKFKSLFCSKYFFFTPCLRSKSKPIRNNENGHLNLKATGLTVAVVVVVVVVVAAAACRHQVRIKLTLNFFERSNSVSVGVIVGVGVATRRTGAHIAAFVVALKKGDDSVFVGCRKKQKLFFKGFFVLVVFTLLVISF